MIIIKLKTYENSLISHLKTPLLFEGHVGYDDTLSAQMVLKIRYL